MIGYLYFQEKAKFKVTHEGSYAIKQRNHIKLNIKDLHKISLLNFRKVWYKVKTKRSTKSEAGSHWFLWLDYMRIIK